MLSIYIIPVQVSFQTEIQYPCPQKWMSLFCTRVVLFYIASVIVLCRFVDIFSLAGPSNTYIINIWNKYFRVIYMFQLWHMCLHYMCIICVCIVCIIRKKIWVICCFQGGIVLFFLLISFLDWSGWSDMQAFLVLMHFCYLENELLISWGHWVDCVKLNTTYLLNFEL